MKQEPNNFVLRVGWINRVLIYWVPILILIFTLPNFVWFWDSFNLYESLKIIFLITIFMVFFEYRIYGFRIELTPEYMIYRKRGFPTFSKRKLYKKDITNHQPVYFGKSKKVRSAYIELDVSGEQVFVNIASFKPSDVKIFENWLGKTEPGGTPAT